MVPAGAVHLGRDHQLIQLFTGEPTHEQARELALGFIQGALVKPWLRRALPAPPSTRR